MTETLEIAAQSRSVIGKANRRLKNAGKVPAVLYGEGLQSVAIQLDRHTTELMLTHQAGHAAIFHVSVDGGKGVDAVIKSMQHDPTKGIVTHIDFMAVRANKPIHSTVPVHFVGESVGVKSGGVFTANIHTLDVESLPKDMPDNIEADISELEVGTNLHVSALVAPAGVTILTDPDTVICAVVAPQLQVEETPVEETAAEPEVIGAKPEAEE